MSYVPQEQGGTEKESKAVTEAGGNHEKNANSINNQRTALTIAARTVIEAAKTQVHYVCADRVGCLWTKFFLCFLLSLIDNDINDLLWGHPPLKKRKHKRKRCRAANISTNHKALIRSSHGICFSHYKPSINSTLFRASGCTRRRWYQYVSPPLYHSLQFATTHDNVCWAYN